MNRDMEMARRIAERVSEEGGHVYYVGGFVRDLLMHRENKDIDIEVHGITPEKLCEILDSLGERTVMGASFGIYGLRHYDIDIALPRREKATGRGHKDFEIFVDPFQGTEKAACRRDFTMNALMQEVLTGEIVDHFSGIRDIERGLIRHVNDETFVEDPLRVFRAAQFAARFGFTVAEETKRISRGMELSALASERVLEELKKALLKADRPSVFFETLKEIGQLKTWFPELEKLSDMQWSHTVRLLDNAAALRIEAKEPLCLMLAALCCGAAQGRGEESAKKMLGLLTNDNRLLEYSFNMLELLSQPEMLVREQSAPYHFRKMYDKSLCPEDLILLAEAYNSTVTDSNTANQLLRDTLNTALADYRVIMAQPCVMGADLINAGLTPGKYFGKALAYAHDLHLSGVPKDEALSRTLELLAQSDG